jgi:transcriptional regulator with XRE-family HTH domain
VLYHVTGLYAVNALESMPESKENTRSDFAKRLASLMDGRSLTQQNLSDGLGVSQATVSRWLGGAVPRRGVLTRLAQLLDTTVEWLLDGFGKAPDSYLPYTNAFTGFDPWKARAKSKKALEESVDKMIERSNASFPGRLRYLRETLLRMSMSEFARRCGYTPSYISRLEGATRANPSIEFVESLIKAFAANREWLFYGSGFPFVRAPAQATAEMFERLNQVDSHIMTASFVRGLARKMGTSDIAALVGVVAQDRNVIKQPDLRKLIVESLNYILLERTRTNAPVDALSLDAIKQMLEVLSTAQQRTEKLRKE